MVLYNVTMNVEQSIEEEFLVWMKNIHIPNVLNTGNFVECKIFRLISSESDGSTYSFQYFAENTTQIIQYQGKHGARLQAEVYERYGERVMSFRTLLEEVI